jgi:hypothetical protein
MEYVGQNASQLLGGQKAIFSLVWHKNSKELPPNSVWLKES